VRSLLEFYIRSGMTASDFAQIEADITAGTNTTGLVNVNTASEMVLACIPGIWVENAPALVAYRQNNRGNLMAQPSVAWVAEVLGQTNAVQAGPYLTGQSYQFTADIAAVGHFGRGYRRVRFVLDTSQGLPRVVYRQDLSHLGWALGRDVRKALQQLAQNRQ
jgi:type II secretory pathway component PulK